MPRAKNKTKALKLTRLHYAGGGLIALAVVILILELTNTTHIFHKQKLVSGTIPTISQNNRQPATTTPAPNVGNGKTASGVSNGSSVTPQKTGANAGALLQAPYGSFVSNHHPGQNGTPSTEASLCNTTPGASCYIKLTQGSIVKKLPSQVTDAGGSTSWNWSIDKAGLTSGSWQVTAVADLGSQSKQTADPMPLEVQ